MKIHFVLEFYAEGGFVFTVNKLTIWTMACIDHSSPLFAFGWFQVDWNKTTILMLR